MRRACCRTGGRVSALSRDADDTAIYKVRQGGGCPLGKVWGGCLGMSRRARALVPHQVLAEDNQLLIAFWTYEVEDDLRVKWAVRTRRMEHIGSICAWDTNVGGTSTWTCNTRGMDEMKGLGSERTSPEQQRRSSQELAENQGAQYPESKTRSGVTVNTAKTGKTRAAERPPGLAARKSLESQNTSGGVSKQMPLPPLPRRLPS